MTDILRFAALLMGAVLMVGAILWPFPGQRAISRRADLQQQMIDAQERELVALRQTVAIYKSLFEKGQR